MQVSPTCLQWVSPTCPQPKQLQAARMASFILPFPLFAVAWAGAAVLLAEGEHLLEGVAGDLKVARAEGALLGHAALGGKPQVGGGAEGGLQLGDIHCVVSRPPFQQRLPDFVAVRLANLHLRQVLGTKVQHTSTMFTLPTNSSATHLHNIHPSNKVSSPKFNPLHKLSRPPPPPPNFFQRPYSRDCSPIQL